MVLTPGNDSAPNAYNDKDGWCQKWLGPRILDLFKMPLKNSLLKHLEWTEPIALVFNSVA